MSPEREERLVTALERLATGALRLGSALEKAVQILDRWEDSRDAR
jgi:hypothetical protein